MGDYPQVDPLVEDEKELGLVADLDSQLAVGSLVEVGTLLAVVGS